MHQLLTKKELANGLHVTTRTLSRWVKAGRLPVVKIGRRALFAVDDINRLIEQSRV